jgi:excisionase family DNA binding protein
MARRRTSRPVAKQPRITFYWDNPPGPRSGGTVERIWRGQVYERDAGPADWLDVPEAAAALGVRHVFSVYRAIWDGRLEAIQRGRDIRVSLDAIKAYLKQEASRPGRKGRRRLKE